MVLAVSTFIAVSTHRNQRLSRLDAFVFSDQSILLKQDTNLQGLGAELTLKGVNYDPDELFWAARLLGWKTFKAGHYRFEQRMGYEQLLSKIGRGLQDPVRYRIRSGQTPSRLAAQLSWNFKADSSSFHRALMSAQAANEAGLDTVTFFSRMLPDTYEFYWDIAPERLVKSVHEAFHQKTADIVQQIEEQAIKTALPLEEAIVLASIVEWEAARDDEKARIAGLYHNRLRRGMRLQADPTVNYAIGERRRLFYADYRVKHPFNTYVIKGLPPAPINNPSLSSIKAALQPEEHDYLYMVAEQGATGYHVFTKSYAAHKRESRKWTQWLREQYRIKEQRQQEQQVELK